MPRAPRRRPRARGPARRETGESTTRRARQRRSPPGAALDQLRSATCSTADGIGYGLVIGDWRLVAADWRLVARSEHPPTNHQPQTTRHNCVAASGAGTYGLRQSSARHHAAYYRTWANPPRAQSACHLRSSYRRSRSATTNTRGERSVAHGAGRNRVRPARAQWRGQDNDPPHDTECHRPRFRQDQAVRRCPTRREGSSIA